MAMTLREKIRWDKAATHRVEALPPAQRALLPEAEAADGPVDLIVATAFTLGEFADLVRRVWDRRELNENGVLYVLYPKKGNKVYEQWIGRDDIFPALGVSDETGFVEDTRMKFNKMFAFDDVFTCIGIKYMP